MDLDINVAVYGSLKRGFSNHFLLMNDYSEYYTSGTTDSGYSMFSLGGFPGVVRDKESDNKIFIEIYKINSNILSNLDLLESNGSFYTRELINISLPKSEIMKCWMYLLPNNYRQYKPMTNHRVKLENNIYNWC